MEDDTRLDGLRGEIQDCIRTCSREICRALECFRGLGNISASYLDLQSIEKHFEENIELVYVPRTDYLHATLELKLTRKDFMLSPAADTREQTVPTEVLDIPMGQIMMLSDKRGSGAAMLTDMSTSGIDGSIEQDSYDEDNFALDKIMKGLGNDPKALRQGREIVQSEYRSHPGDIGEVYVSASESETDDASDFENPNPNKTIRSALSVHEKLAKELLKKQNRAKKRARLAAAAATAGTASAQLNEGVDIFSTTQTSVYVESDDEGGEIRKEDLSKSNPCILTIILLPAEKKILSELLKSFSSEEDSTKILTDEILVRGLTFQLDPWISSMESQILQKNLKCSFYVPTRILLMRVCTELWCREHGLCLPVHPVSIVGMKCADLDGAGSNISNSTAENSDEFTRKDYDCESEFPVTAEQINDSFTFYLEIDRHNVHQKAKFLLRIGDNARRNLQSRTCSRFLSFIDDFGDAVIAASEGCPPRVCWHFVLQLLQFVRFLSRLSTSIYWSTR